MGDETEKSYFFITFGVIAIICILVIFGLLFSLGGKKETKKGPTSTTNSTVKQQVCAGENAC